jgi:hypothetical protein
LDHAIAFYKNLFGPAPGNLVKMSDDLWSSIEILNADDNIDLTRPFTIEEIKNALF